MRTLAAVLGLFLLLGSVPAAEAGWWIFKNDKASTRKKLPKAVDSPVVRPKMQEIHKNGKRAGHHPEHGNQIR